MTLFTKLSGFTTGGLLELIAPLAAEGATEGAASSSSSSIAMVTHPNLGVFLIDFEAHLLHNSPRNNQTLRVLDLVMRQ